MATIIGPKVQIPTALQPMHTEDGIINPQWQGLFTAVQQIVTGVSRSGPTASRPTDLFKGRFIGMPFFDSTLGMPIYLKSVNPDVWVKADGTAA